MRPKPAIICVAQHEDRLCERVFLLETHGYRVLRAQSLERAAELMLGEEIRVVLIDLPMRDLALLSPLRELRRDVATIVVSHKPGYTGAIDAVNWLPAGADSAAEILNRIRIVTARKRGPKPRVEVER